MNAIRRITSKNSDSGSKSKYQCSYSKIKFFETDQTVQMHGMESHYTDIKNKVIKVNINNTKIIYDSVFW